MILVGWIRSRIPQGKKDPKIDKVKLNFLKVLNVVFSRLKAFPWASFLEA
jgi:hypothetical protein